MSSSARVCNMQPTLVADLQQLVVHPTLQRQSLCSAHTLSCSYRRPRQQSRAWQASVLCHTSGQVIFSGKPGAAGTCTFQRCFKLEPGSTQYNHQSWTARLQSYGYAGVASYGLLNTAYYITAFFFFWTRVAKVPKGLGLQEAAKQFVGVMSLTWAGSQVTKVARIGAALAVAPFLDAACSRAQQQLGLKSQRTALSLVVALCLGVAAVCFGGTVLLWA